MARKLVRGVWHITTEEVPPMRKFFGKTMLGAVVGVATLLVSQGITPETIGAAVTIILTAAGLRDAIAKNGSGQ